VGAHLRALDADAWPVPVHGSQGLGLAVAATGILATMPYIALQLVGIESVLTVIGTGGSSGSAFTRDLPLIIAFAVVAAYTYLAGLRAPALIAFVKDALIWPCSCTRTRSPRDHRRRDRSGGQRAPRFRGNYPVATPCHLSWAKLVAPAGGSVSYAVKVSRSPASSTSACSEQALDGIGLDRATLVRRR
jgi:hypothetical protein